jgi:ABC-type branched-subunit amino acid transport system substrate-binding protein
LFAATALFGASPAQAQSGEDIFQEGGGKGPPIQARLAGKFQLPASGFFCASCHGIDGSGKREGAGQVPSVTWEALSAPRPESAMLSARPAYDDRSLVLAVTQGVDSANRPLSVAMPRYALSEPQTAALIAYLKQLGRGDAREEGVYPTLIRVGTALPLSGPRAAVGTSLRQLLTGIFAHASVAGIYGRRIQLVSADTATEGVDSALKRLVDVEHVFALVATEGPTAADGIAGQVPVIGVLDDAGTVVSRRVFRLATPLRERVVALLRYAEQSGGPNLRVAVIGRVGAPGHTALDAPGLAAARIVLDWHDLARAHAAIAAAEAAGAQAILVLAPRDTVATVHVAMAAAGVTLPLLVPGEPSEDAVAESEVALSLIGTHPVRVAFAGLAPNQIDETGFRTVAAPESDKPERSLMAYETYASAVVFAEALKAVGRRLDRAALVEALEALRDVRTGTLPPITFGPHRHDGLSGAAIIGFAADGHATFLAPWQPAENVSHR